MNLGPKRVFSAIIPVPTSATDYAVDKLVTLHRVNVCNTTGGALTFTLRDRQTPARAIFSAISIPAGNVLSYMPGDYPDILVGGMTLQASGAGLEASIVAFQAI